MAPGGDAMRGMVQRRAPEPEKGFGKSTRNNRTMPQLPEVEVLEMRRTTMKTLRFLDSTGDREVRFDETDALSQARLEAQHLFERALANGAVAFSVNRGGGQSDQKVGDFSSLEDETVVVPRIVGG
jgi:hypothetical protein